MSLFTRSLWPESVRFPYRRLGIGLLVSPLVITAALTLAAFLLAGMSEQTGDAVVAVTIDSAIALGVLVFGYAATFGMIGIAVLWALGQRGPLTWTIAGLVSGAVAGLLFDLVAMKELYRALLAIFAVSGMAHFMLVRMFAGIQDDNRAG